MTIVHMLRDKKSALGAVYLLTLFAGYGWLLWRVAGTTYLSPVSIGTAVKALGGYGPILFITVYSLRPFFFFPAIILTLAGRLAFGPLWGTIYTVIGATAGAGFCFYTASLLGRNRINWLQAKYRFLAVANNCCSRHGVMTVLTARLMLPYDPVSYAAGLSGMRFGDYIIGTILGTVPGAFAYNFLVILCINYSHRLFTGPWFWY